MAGAAPEPAHRESATAVPSDCRQETLRVSVSVALQVLLSWPQVPAFHEYVQVLVLEKVPVVAPSVPHEAVVGVQFWVVAGAVPAQNVFATVVPSLRTQVTGRVSLPESAFTTQVPVRDWGRLVPQPALGVHEE